MKDWNINLNKKELLKYMGSISQLGGLKRYELTEGRAKGVEAVDVVTGTGLDFTVLPGRCMDITWCRYKGIPISYQSKAELSSGAYLEQEGAEWLRSFYAGMLTTCGFSNVGDACQEERRAFGMQKHGLHGRLSHIPATQVCCKEIWSEDRYIMTIEGQMRQSAVHGENMVLRRRITTQLGQKKIWLHDEIENEGHVSEPMMLLYHMNFGYPLLDENSRLVTNSVTVVGTDPVAQAEVELHNCFHKPENQQNDRCYFHELQTDKAGKTQVALINDKLELGIVLRFDKKQLPCMTEWKMLGCGEYVVGLEPGTVNPIGRIQAKKQNKMPYLEPGAVWNVDIELEILDSIEEIKETEISIRKLGGDRV